METGVDDLHAGVAKRPCDDLRPPVVPIKSGLGDDDTYLCSHNPESREDLAQVERRVMGKPCQ